VLLLQGAEPLGREVPRVVFVVDQPVAGVAEQQEVLLGFPVRDVLGEAARRARGGGGTDVVGQFANQHAVQVGPAAEQRR
jgi:hypothetical protein